MAASNEPDVVVKESHTLSDTHSSGPKKIISREEIASRGITSLSQALQSLGGVQLQDTTGNGNQVMLSMRGFGSNATSNTLFMVNGIPITNPDIAPPDLNAIPVQEIEYIEIVAGSESVLYGDQAVGGIINVVTRQQFNKRFILSCAGGSYNQRNCYAAAGNHFHNVSFGLGALTDHTDNYRQHNDYDQNLLSGRVDIPYQTGSLEVDFKIANEDMQYPGALTAEEVEEDRRQANNDIDYFRDWNGFYHLGEQQRFNDQWRMELDLARRDMHGNGVLFLPFNQMRVIQYLKPQVIGTIGQSIFRTGIEAESDQYHLDSDFGNTGDTLQKYGLFTLLNTPFNEKLIFTAGVRGAQQNSQLDSFGDLNTINRAIATTLGLTYQMYPTVKWYLREAGSYRFPKADENASTPPGVLGLKTQRGIAYESGVNWDYKKFTTNLAIFQLNLRDEITFDPTQTPEDPFGTNRNYAPTLRYGLSISENYQITKQLMWGSQYNYINARFQNGINAGKRIPLVSEQIFHTGIDYAFYEHWNVYTEVIFTGNQFSANDDANVGKLLGGYTTYNMSLRYVYQQFTATFRVNNIFNKYYYFYTVYQPMLPIETFYPAPGINALLNLKYVFE